MYVSGESISSSCLPPPSWGPGSWQQSSDRQTKREYSSRGRPVRTNTRGRGSGSRDVPPRFANNPAAKNMRNERKSGDYDVDHGSNSVGTDGKETYDDDVFEQKDAQADVFKQERPPSKENKTGHERRQFSNSITGPIQPLMEIETHRPNHMIGSKSVGLGSQQRVFSSRSSKSSSSSEALSSGSEGGTEEWKTVGTGRRGSRKESKPDTSKRFKSDSKRFSGDIGEWKEVSSRHRQEYVSKSRNSRSSFSSGSSSPREGTGRLSQREDSNKENTRRSSHREETGRLSPREDSRRSSNKENTRRSSHREETGRSSPTEDSRRSSAREDTKRSLPREETERSSYREDPKRLSPREETGRLSHREGTGRSSTREDSRRSSYREGTGRSSPREETKRASPREDFRRSSPREETKRSSHREDTKRSSTERTGKSSARERTEKSSHKESTGKSSPSEGKKRSYYVEDSERLSLQGEDQAILAIADWAEEVRSTSPAQWVDPEVLSPGWEERPVQKDVVSWIGKTWQETLKELEEEKSEWKPKVVYFSPELHEMRR